MQPDGLLVTDIDGTLLDQHGHLPTANCDALRRWVDQGLTLALATGRNLTITRPIAETIAEVIDQEFFLILQDGCLVMQYPSQRILQYHNLPLAEAQAAGQIFYDEKLSVLLFDPLPHGEGFMLHKNGPLPPGLAHYVHRKTGQFIIQPGGAPLTVAPSKLVTINRQASINDIYQRLKTTLPAIRVLRTEAIHLGPGAWFLEVGPLQASKLAALKWLTQYLGRDLSAVIAVGDAENDIEMIQAAGLGVAMANASDRVKTVADQVIGSNVEAGLAHFLLSLLGAG